jgi:hypothetical protein
MDENLKKKSLSKNFRTGWVGFWKSYVIFRAGHSKCLRLLTRWVGGVKKGQKYAYVIFEWSLNVTENIVVTTYHLYWSSLWVHPLLLYYPCRMLSIFDRSLIEAVQGIASSSTFFPPFAQILEYFVILWFRTSLDMFTSLDKFVELYQFASEVLELQYKSKHVRELYQIAS